MDCVRSGLNRVLIGLILTTQGGTIRGSINLPAQSLPLTLPSVYAMFKSAGLRKVIFYCGALSPSNLVSNFFRHSA